jgi:hypothetical protein
VHTTGRDRQVQTAEPRRSARLRSARRGFALPRALRWLAGGGTLAAAAGIFLGQALFAPNHELLYRGAVSAAHCVNIEERDACSFVYELSVGNTGKQAQERVRVAWPLDMQRWHLETRIADIVGSARPTQQPQVRPEFGPDKTGYTIDGLMPNTLVQLRMSCSVCTRAQLQAMRTALPAIEARGAVSEGDPRVSTLWRGFTNLLRVFGLFG